MVMNEEKNKILLPTTVTVAQAFKNKNNRSF
jgi:hypothetical protein